MDETTKRLQQELSKKTLVMGILNVTPDSFSDGGLYFPTAKKAIERSKQMIKEGADIIDIGGESTRPGAQLVSAEEELARVLPTIRALKNTSAPDTFISVDTYKSEVARAALAEGADMVNSLGGSLFDPHMYEVIARSKCPVIVYHIKGKPRTMQQGDIVYTDVVSDIMDFFRQQLTLAQNAGVSKEQFLIDPGIGFGKTVNQNLEIIRRLYEFIALKSPIVIGVSRKSHLGIILKEAFTLDEIPSPTDRLEASLAETALAILAGASIVRTHDVLPTKKCIAVVDAVKRTL